MEIVGYCSVHERVHTLECSLHCVSVRGVHDGIGLGHLHGWSCPSQHQHIVASIRQDFRHVASEEARSARERDTRHA